MDTTKATKPELVQFCRDNKLINYSALRKPALILKVQTYLDSDKKIIEKNDSRILVSEEHAYLLLDYKWYIGKEGYVGGTINSKTYRLHRYIIKVVLQNKLSRNDYVDHIDNNKLNNKIDNLRIVTAAENSRNKTNKKTTSSLYYGVTKRSDNKYQVRLRQNNINLDAYYTSELHAAWQWNLWIDENNITHSNKNNIEQPVDFIKSIKIERDLPKYISMHKGKFIVRVNNVHYSSYKILVEAEEKLKLVLLEINTTRITNIKNTKIIRSSEGYACITRVIKDNTYNILVDDEDYYKLLIINKLAISNGYANITIDNIKSQLHRYLMNYTGDMLVDHINNNKLDNRKVNLRIVTCAQNSQNTSSQKNSSSKYVGVGWDKYNNKWTANIVVNNVRKFVGRFVNEDDAAKARDKMAFEYLGEYANLNFSL